MLTNDLLEKYSVSIPRYTSYPTVPEWTEEFTKEDFFSANDKANKNKSPISLYFHLPFCESQCYFCACNIVISKKRDIVNPYLLHIKKEIKNLSNFINKIRKVEQIHLGGGTPTYFNPDELKDFFSTIRENYNISKNCEIGVEVDPRVTTLDHLKTLSDLGFNRLSMGVQDFDPNVQVSVNRIQPYEDTKNLFNHARELGFESINVDLIYGLPYQTKESFSKTIDLVIKLNPDRIALFHYAHLPQLINHQAKHISSESLPSSDVKIKIFQHAVQSLTDNNYVFIGLDHFAKPDDELTQARKNKTLHRNFQGYTTKAQCDLYGFGITAISSIQNTFSQNLKKLNPYYDKIDLNELSIYRGFVLNKDDLLREEVIMKILCHGVIIKTEIEEKYNIDFGSYFSFELDKLKEFERDGLVCLDNNIEVTDTGQFFLRNIAGIFDFYLQRKNGKQKIYSKSI
ncbi:MAG: oxygen-independent coproporphyrinogen III oxidase [Candidatus Melainabacteria bacterium]|nr:oxygen-independent coproporphyrinogen III oxidase [Candidatus Melainabacteria bacterium]